MQDENMAVLMDPELMEKMTFSEFCFSAGSGDAVSSISEPLQFAESKQVAIPTDAAFDSVANFLDFNVFCKAAVGAFIFGRSIVR